MATEESTKFVPDAPRLELAVRIAQKAYLIGRALETMQESAFDEESEADPAQLYAVASRELGARVRALAAAAIGLLTRADYNDGDAWEALHG
jgi:hypothetical protein